MPGKNHDIIGLDIGTSSLKLVWLTKNENNYELLGSAVKNFPRHYDTSASQEEKSPLAENIKSAIFDIGCTAKKVFVSLSGPHLYVKRISVVSMPKEELKEAIRWIIKDQISINSERVLIEYYILEEKKDDKGTNQLDILVAVAEKKLIFDSIAAITESGLMPLGINLSPFALESFFVNHKIDAGSKSGVEVEPTASVIAVLDIGSSKAELVLYKNGVPQFSRMLPGSGGEFTRAMTGVLASDHGRLELSYEEAEHLKIEIGIPSQESGLASEKENISNMQILAMLRPVLERLASEIKRSFDYCKFQLKMKEPQKIYLTGGGSLLRNIDIFLKKELNVDVDFLNSLSSQRIDGFKTIINKKDQKPAFFDIALATALDESRRINLFPAELKMEKMRKIEKTSLRIMALISTSILLFSFLSINFQIYNLEKQIKIANNNYEIMREITLINDKITKKKSIFSQFNLGHYDSAAALKILSSVMPASFELDSFSRREDNKIDMRGTVISSVPEAVLASFIKAIQDTGVFKNVKIVSMQKNTNQDMGSNISISCEMVSK